MQNKTSNLSIGEWVRGESKEGALIHGYIETINSNHGTVKVKVVASDNDKLIGKTIEILNKVEALPFIEAKTEEELLGLIDLALANQDKEWFMQLTEKLKSIKNKVNADLSPKKTVSFGDIQKSFNQERL